MKVSDIVENTGHDAKSTGGFDYQFLYFVNKLVCMSQKGEVVSYEKHDDVSLQDGDTLTYYQLKHTMLGTEEKPANLTLRDPDLWKAIYVWIDIANKQKNPKDFLESNMFVLVTNKASMDNLLWQNIQKLKNNKISYKDVKDFCQKTYDDSKESGVQNRQAKKEKSTKVYIKTLIDFEYAEELLRSMKIEFEAKLRENILDSLEHNKSIPHKNIEYAFHELIGAIRDKYETQHVNSYDRESFNKSFGRIFNKYSERKFTFKKRITTELPKHLEKQTFIQQLIDVQDITENDIVDIIEYTTEKLDYINNVREFLQNEEISNEEIEETWAEAIRIWKQKFRYYFKNANSEKEIINQASELLNVIRDKELDYVEGKLTAYFSNGCYYYLSDKDDEHEPRIGWRPGWKEKYTNNGSTI